MGAQQSTGGGSAADNDATTKTSYYELLGVERIATEDEIKRAYRKKALELHPDRNYGDVERATALFAEVQTAYEVLSDVQERAWYDAHERDILRGGAGEGADEDHYEHNMKVTTADDLARMMGKFRSNVEFTDAPTGFYGFVRETFEQLAKEEQYAADWDGVEAPDYPSFGHKDDTYEGVVRDFYAAWAGFATKKSFAWKDKYRLSEAPDRRVRRLMEKENKRFREDGVREFNDAVRALLLFIRKRDPRFTPNTQSADERAAAQRAATKERAAKAKVAQNEALMNEKIPEWATRRDPDQFEEDEEEEDEEPAEEHFECVACHKTFKSERQYDAHEKSKKHQKAVQALKRRMRKDNVELNLDEDVLSSGAITPVEPEGGEDNVDHIQAANGRDECSSDVANELEHIDLNNDATESDKKESLHLDEEVKEEDGNMDQDASSSDESEQAPDDKYASRFDIENRLSSLQANSNLPKVTKTEPEQEQVPAAPKLGKAAQKRAKKAAKQSELEDSDLKHKCVTCNSAFPSKTQLFQHIKDHGHAAPIPVTKGGISGAGGKKKGKRK